VINTYTTCDGCGEAWPGEGNGGTPPGITATFELCGIQDSYIASKPFHFCTKDCVALWAAPDHKTITSPWICREIEGDSHA
jgi:hypothetical protein